MEKTEFEAMLNKRQLSRIQARMIAESQHDLGGKGKENMTIALGGFAPCSTDEELIEMRLKAFEKLDPLSQFIVTEFIDSQSIDKTIDSIQYAIRNLQSAIESIKQQSEN